MVIFEYTYTTQYLEIILISIGLILGIALYFFLRKKENKVFLIFLSANSGFIFGLFIFDIIFLYGSLFFIKSMLIETVAAFIISSIIAIHAFPFLNIYYNSFMGGYILIRGVSILFSKIEANFAYRDLQLLIYLIGNYESESAQYFMTNIYSYYWLYDICIICLIAISITYYKLNTKNDNNDELMEDSDDEDKEEEADGENQQSGELSSKTE